MTPSQLERRWLTLWFRRQHYWNRRDWAKTSWEQGEWSRQALAVTDALIELELTRRDLERQQATAALTRARPDRSGRTGAAGSN